ncbi:cardioacceleratory peptide receptor-like [Aplysia californica]|uniref:Cardioacceleratory peptide receptor-like n=1 Tax=Aplysia californica TaxID=6500 RepID=A0ABM0JW07_APLCA|nr:cardioacceleratory peptide receptor-like [Aplysia californica]XP_035826819.1 cardioacceleratory peptide receptor-like [Aplysia californica]
MEDIFTANTTQDYDLVSTTPSANTTMEIVFNFYQEEQLTFLYILFTMIVLGNSLVIVAIGVTKSRKSRMHLFILNLAIADLSAGLISVLTDIVWKNTIDWRAGQVGCKIVRYSQGVVTYASTYALVALSFDRLNAIARPLSFSGDKRRVRVLLSLAWGFALLFSVPMLIINELKFVNGKWQCWIEFPQPWIWKLYLTSIAVVLFFIPAIIIAVCYIIIVVIIWHKTGLHGPMSAEKTTTQYIKNGGQVYVAANNARFRESGTSSRGVIPRAKIKTIKMTLVIVLVFIICWSPYFVFDLLSVYGYIEHTQDTVGTATFIQSLAPLNSAANPIIYAAFNTKMCVDLFRCRHRHRRGSSPNNTAYYSGSAMMTNRRLVREKS